MHRLQSLRVGGVVLVISAFVLGLIASAIWFQSNSRWSTYLEHARFAGAVLYDSLQSGGTPPDGVEVTTLPPEDQQRAERGQFDAISDIPRPSHVTNVSIRPQPVGRPGSAPLGARRPFV